MTPRILVVGGLDPTGGAGITADVRMAAVLGVDALPIAACLTVQNRHGFDSLSLTPDEVFVASIHAAVGDGPLDAVKLGLVGDADRLELAMSTCADALPGIPIVVDPVLSATSGGLEVAEELVAAYRRLAPRCTVMTPNDPELARLAPAGAATLGCAHVLVTGGHAAGEVVEDRLVHAGGEVVFRHPRLRRGAIHGTGCALATAVAAHLALGAGVESACRQAIDRVAACVADTPAVPVGRPVPLRITASRTPG